MVTITDWFERKIIQVTIKIKTFIRNIKRRSYEERLTNDRFKFDVDIRQTRERGDNFIIMIYNILNHRIEMDARFMKMNTHSRTRGHTKKLKIEIKRILFANRITKRWNGLIF